MLVRACEESHTCIGWFLISFPAVANPELETLGAHPLKREFSGSENLRPVLKFGELVPDNDGLDEGSWVFRCPSFFSELR